MFEHQPSSQQANIPHHLVGKCAHEWICRGVRKIMLSQFSSVLGLRTLAEHLLVISDISSKSTRTLQLKVPPRMLSTLSFLCARLPVIAVREVQRTTLVSNGNAKELVVRRMIDSSNHGRISGHQISVRFFVQHLLVSTTEARVTPWRVCKKEKRKTTWITASSQSDPQTSAHRQHQKEQ